jgi:hypothetical protein
MRLSYDRSGRAVRSSSASREARGLKHRAVNETRSSPILPALVRIVRAPSSGMALGLAGDCSAPHAVGC